VGRTRRDRPVRRAAVVDVRAERASTDEVEEVVFRGVFEGYAQAFIGTDEVSPFRVYAMTDPTRVVVEVRNDDV
jgi:hypothetical protein